MRSRNDSNQQRQQEVLNRYVNVAGKNLLTRKRAYDLPPGWITIVIELFDRVRRYHPEAKIVDMIIAQPVYSLGFRFIVSFTTPTKGTQNTPPRLPRSLRWIEIQARKKALETCAQCGRPLGSLRSKNRCSVCACKDSVRHFDYA